VVVTGGTGALGRAVVGALLAAGAHCHVPYRQEREKEGLPSGALSLITVPSLADEAAVAKLYGGLPALWASIHIAGGFAFAPLADTSGELLRRLIDDNLVSCFLCCREAVAAMRRGKAGGRIVNVAARQALEPRTGANISASTAAKAGVAALSAALGEELAGEESW
jgi:NAD(P)-dependent dehydrogenase (short-subunit alcohol dehydrogenase family)